jgi:hypothetical protein
MQSPGTAIPNTLYSDTGGFILDESVHKSFPNGVFAQLSSKILHIVKFLTNTFNNAIPEHSRITVKLLWRINYDLRTIIWIDCIIKNLSWFPAKAM